MQRNYLKAKKGPWFYNVRQPWQIGHWWHLNQYSSLKLIMHRYYCSYFEGDAKWGDIRYIFLSSKYKEEPKRMKYRFIEWNIWRNIYIKQFESSNITLIWVMSRDHLFTAKLRTKVKKWLKLFHEKKSV